MNAARNKNLEGLKTLVTVCPELVTNDIKSFIKNSREISKEIKDFLTNKFPEHLGQDAENNLVRSL